MCKCSQSQAHPARYGCEQAATQPAVQDDDTPSEGWPAYHKRKMTTMLDLMRGLRDRYKARLAASPAQSEVQRLKEVVSSLIDIAHEHRHELQQQRFSDNDEGDAFARHRDSRVGRIDRILRAALAASTGQEVEK